MKVKSKGEITIRFFENYTNYRLMYDGGGTYGVGLIEEKVGYSVYHRFNIGNDNRPHRLIFADIQMAIEMALEIPRVCTGKAIRMAADMLGYDYKSDVWT